MDKIEKIRAEIERRINILTNVYDEQMERKDEEMMTYYHGKVIALEELLSFLDTLSEKPDKSLEEAAEEYRRESFKKSVMPQIDGPVSEYGGSIKNAFIAGAEWQASQMPMPEDTVLFNKGVVEGRRLEREDMLKDAVEGEVYLYHSYNRDATAILVDTPKENLGDKVRIVLLKAEEE